MNTLSDIKSKKIGGHYSCFLLIALFYISGFTTASVAGNFLRGSWLADYNVAERVAAQSVITFNGNRTFLMVSYEFDAVINTVNLIRFSGKWEPENLNSITGLVKEGDILLKTTSDIGTHFIVIQKKSTNRLIMHYLSSDKKTVKKELSFNRLKKDATLTTPTTNVVKKMVGGYWYQKQRSESKSMRVLNMIIFQNDRVYKTGRVKLSKTQELGDFVKKYIKEHKNLGQLKIKLQTRRLGPLREGDILLVLPSNDIYPCSTNNTKFQFIRIMSDRQMELHCFDKSEKFIGTHTFMRSENDIIR